jgi:hypothetical protein
MESKDLEPPKTGGAPRSYPLDVDPLTGQDGEGLGYFSKGHHDPEAFVREASHFDGLLYPAKYVRHAYYRAVPSQNDDLDTIYYETKPGRGAWPVTLIENYQVPDNEIQIAVEGEALPNPSAGEGTNPVTSKLPQGVETQAPVHREGL